MSGGPADGEGTPRIRITGGNPSTEEIAAITAVLTVALDELAASTREREDPAPNAWQRAAHAVRTPLSRGDWRRPHA